ncbi:phosphatidylserine decarboxylase family protein [Bacteroidota bacterium]
MKVHREGYRILLLFTVILILFNLFLHSEIAVLLSVLLIAFLFLFFRVPNRPERESQYNEILSPADGKVVAIEEVIETEFFNEKRIQISVFMSIWNVHVNWYPFGGTVIYKKYHPGKYLVARHPKSSSKNERNCIVIRNNEKSIMVKQIAGTVARRIICYADENIRIEQGKELGFIKFGSRLDVLIPTYAIVQVKMNEKVRGKLSVLATF